VIQIATNIASNPQLSRRRMIALLCVKRDLATIASARSSLLVNAMKRRISARRGGLGGIRRNSIVRDSPASSGRDAIAPRSSSRGLARINEGLPNTSARNLRRRAGRRRRGRSPIRFESSQVEATGIPAGIFRCYFRCYSGYSVPQLSSRSDRIG